MAKYEIRLKCDGMMEPVTTLRIEPGWSPSLNEPCVFITGWNTVVGLSSVEVSRGYPEDCAAVPEAPMTAMLLVGLVALRRLTKPGLRGTRPLGR